MGMWDIDDLDEKNDEDISNQFLEMNKNIYLSNPSAALKLVSKIIPISHKDNRHRTRIKNLGNILSRDVLRAFRNIKLSTEAQLQVKLISLGDKLYDQQKYSMLRNRAVVGIGGKFSAGKSSFINSLLKTGNNLLPEDQNPTTSIPTYIVHGDVEKISAFTSYGEKVQLDYDALQALTHKFYDEYGMGFSNFIGGLMLEAKDMPYENLVFLDTPGYSKADQHEISGKKQRRFSDRNKAYEQLRSVDYLVWLVDIENGTLSETDVEFIKELNVETRVMIVVNKADKKIDREIESVVNTVKEIAIDSGINLFDVVAYSSVENAEWRDTKKISSFLEQAKKREKTDDDNVINQFSRITEEISREIEHIISNNKEEQAKLSEIIFKSKNIIAIKTFVEMYGETLAYMKRLRRCKRVFDKSTEQTEKLMKMLTSEEVKHANVR